MKQYGDLELINGQIINCKIENLSNIPTFGAEDKSRVIYNLSDDTIYFNNGTSYVPLQIANQNSNTLITTLGREWINADLSFNPTPFNDLTFISNLTANDSLLTVFQKLDQSLIQINTILLNEIQSFNIQDPVAGDIIFYNGSNFVNVPVNNIPNFNISIDLADLNDVNLSEMVTNNESIFFNSTENKFVNKKWSFVYTNNAPQSNHVVVHNLNTRYSSVTVINSITNIQIDPSSLNVSYDTVNQLTVNIPVATPVIILVICIPN